MPRGPELGLSALLLLALAARPTSAVPLSEAQFLSFATARPGRAVLLDAPVALAESEVRRARNLANPVLDFEREESDQSGNQTTWSLSWQPPLDPRRGALHSAAETAVATAGHERSLAALEWRLEARRAFADWSIAAERTSVSGDLLERIGRVVVFLEDQVRLGEASGLSLQRVKLAGVELDAASAEARAELARAGETALVWIGRSGEFEPTLPSLPEPSVGRGTDSHPALAARRADVAREEHLARASARYLSFPTLSAGVRNNGGPGRAESGLVLGGSLELPLFDRQQADRLASRARLSAAKALLDLETQFHQRHILFGMGRST